MPATLLISTRNRDKYRELSLMLGDKVILRQPDADDPDVEETGDTLWENALLKARDGFERHGIPTIADDTGLEVDALDGRPGVYSSRYAGEDASYEDNVTLLLQELDSVPLEKRTARFRSVIAYIDGDRIERFDGVLEGTILEVRRGKNGFGYDPVFLPEEGDLTLAEMGAEAKNEISHRGRALRSFVEWWNSFNAE